MRRMKKRVVNQTLFHGPQDSLAVPLILRPRGLQFEAEGTQPRWLRGFFGQYANPQSLDRQRPRPQIFDGIVASTGAERSQQELWRRHPFVGAAQMSGLVAKYPVPAGLDFKLCIAEVLNGRFHSIFFSVLEDAGEREMVTLTDFVTSVHDLHRCFMKA
jgi:hypothetical protein